MDKEDRATTLVDNLFTIISSLNTVVDRIDVLGDKLVALPVKYEELLKQAKQQVLQRIILKRSKMSRGVITEKTILPIILSMYGKISINKLITIIKPTPPPTTPPLPPTSDPTTPPKIAPLIALIILLIS